MRHYGWLTGRATTTSTEPQITRGTPAARPVALPEGPPRRWPLVWGHYRLGRTSVDRCAFQRTFAASTLTSRHSVWCPIVGTQHQQNLLCRSKAIWWWSVRWHEVLLISRWRSTWWQVQTRSVLGLDIGWRCGLLDTRGSR